MLSCFIFCTSHSIIVDSIAIFLHFWCRKVFIAHFDSTSFSSLQSRSVFLFFWWCRASVLVEQFAFLTQEATTELTDTRWCKKSRQTHDCMNDDEEDPWSSSHRLETSLYVSLISLIDNERGFLSLQRNSRSSTAPFKRIRAYHSRVSNSIWSLENKNLDRELDTLRRRTWLRLHWTVSERLHSQIIAKKKDQLFHGMITTRKE